MRISDILLEVANRIKPVLAKIVKNHNLDPETLEFIEERIDYITDNPNYQQWLSKELLKHSEENPDLDADGWKELLGSEKWHDLKSALKNFISVKDKLPEKDISKYRIRDISRNFSDDNFKEFGNHPSTLLRVTPEDLDGVEVVKKEGGIKTYSVSEPDALEQIGQGSKWCTRAEFRGDQSQAAYYIDTYGKTYVGTMNGRLVAQWTPNAGEMKDINNDDFEVENFGTELFYSDEITKNILKDLKDFKEGAYDAFVNYMHNIMPGKDRLIENFFNESLSKFDYKRGLFDPTNRILLDICVQYTAKSKTRWKELETILSSIKTNDYDNLLFWYNIVNEYTRIHRWPEASQLLYHINVKTKDANPYSDEFTFELKPGSIDIKKFEEYFFTVEISYSLDREDETIEYAITDIEAVDDNGKKVMISAHNIDVLSEYIVDNMDDEIRDDIYRYAVDF